MGDKIDETGKVSQVRNSANNSKEADSRAKAIDPRSSGSGETKQFDPFYKDVVFPDPAAVFFFQPASVLEIKDNACIVLDTTALLLPYTGQLERKSLDAIERTYSRLIEEDRLVIPAQAAREFAHNRAKKVAEIFEEVSKLDFVQFCNTLGSRHTLRHACFPTLITHHAKRRMFIKSQAWARA